VGTKFCNFENCKTFACRAGNPSSIKQMRQSLLPKKGNTPFFTLPRVLVALVFALGCLVAGIFHQKNFAEEAVAGVPFKTYFQLKGEAEFNKFKSLNKQQQIEYLDSNNIIWSCPINFGEHHQERRNLNFLDDIANFFTGPSSPCGSEDFQDDEQEKEKKRKKSSGSLAIPSLAEEMDEDFDPFANKGASLNAHVAKTASTRNVGSVVKSGSEPGGKVQQAIQKIEAKSEMNKAADTKTISAKGSVVKGPPITVNKAATPIITPPEQKKAVTPISPAAPAPVLSQQSSSSSCPGAPATRMHVQCIYADAAMGDIAHPRAAEHLCSWLEDFCSDCKSGCTVIKQHMNTLHWIVREANKEPTWTENPEFDAKMSAADSAVLYFANHGNEHQGRMYIDGHDYKDIRKKIMAFIRLAKDKYTMDKYMVATQACHSGYIFQMKSEMNLPSWEESPFPLLTTSGNVNAAAFTGGGAMFMNDQPQTNVLMRRVGINSGSREFLRSMKAAQKQAWVTNFKEHVRRMVDGTPIKTFELDFPIKQKKKRTLSWQFKSPTPISFMDWGLDPVIFFIFPGYEFKKEKACGGEAHNLGEGLGDAELFGLTAAGMKIREIWHVGQENYHVKYDESPQGFQIEDDDGQKMIVYTSKTEHCDKAVDGVGVYLEWPVEALFGQTLAQIRDPANSFKSKANLAKEQIQDAKLDERIKADILAFQTKVEGLSAERQQDAEQNIFRESLQVEKVPGM